MQVHGLDGAIDCLLLMGTLIKPLYQEVNFCGKHIHLLHCMHAFLLFILEPLITPTLIGDHLLNENYSFVDCE